MAERLSALINRIRRELSDAQSDYLKQLESGASVGPPFSLDEVTLDTEVTTSTTDTGDVGVNVWVVSGSADRAETGGNTQRVSVRLKPATPFVLGSNEKGRKAAKSPRKT